ncbi:MAG: hypothetical protein Kow0074_05090 [Candidatus Zixiibacteriota bacterium]
MTNDDYLWDRKGSPDPDVQALERLLGEFGYRPEPRAMWRRPTMWVVIPVAAAAILVLSFILQRGHDESVRPQWTASVTVGSPALDNTPITSDRVVSDGQWLVTDGTSRMRIDLGGNGEVFLEPGSRLQIVSTEPGQQRMILVVGMVHVALWSPDDVAIETPSAIAVERDGEFVLAVNNDDHVCLSVNVGRVTMRDGMQESIVPAGAVCEAYPETGPGTPFCESAPDRFRLALERYDLSKHNGAQLEAVLSEAGTCDLVPLWHLLQRVDTEQRGRIFDYMARLQPPPASVTRAGIIRLEPEMLDYWWDTIRHYHSCLICDETSAAASSVSRPL